MRPSKTFPFVSTSFAARERKRSHLQNSRKPQSSYEALEPRQLLATIVWSSGDITGDSDISTNGTAVFAINGSNNTGQTTNVNGVSFVTATRASAGTLSQAQSPGSESLFVTLGNDNVRSFDDGGLNSSVGDIIEGGWWGSDNGNSATVSLIGLTIGDLYEVQLFANDARNSRDDGYITRLDNGAGGTGIDLELNNQPNGGRPGDFGIGTFTADSSIQSFNISGFLNGNADAGRIHVNAIQLRRLDSPQNTPLQPGAVPVINEFLASNSSTIDDDNGNSTDFIEIFNAGQDSLNLAGYTLTDDPADPNKYQFPSTVLDGGEYLVVFAGDDADPTSGNDLYTGFGLSSSGEYLGFFDASGALISEFGTDNGDGTFEAFPGQTTDISYGLLNDGNLNSVSFFATPTPGSANVNPIDGVIDSFPAVSVERGFYDDAFDVDVVSQTAGATLVYTTDGSEPSLTNGIQVPAPNAGSFAQITLNIAETTSLRTGSFQPNVLTLGTTTHSYVFLDDVLEQTLIDQSVIDQYSQDILRDALLDLPTVSFNFDDEIGRFDAEQRTSIEYLSPDGSEGFQVDAGISPFGGNATDFAKRNFRINFRGEYGTSRLEFPLFEDFDDGVTPATTSFDSLEFRAGSHDRLQRGFGLSNRFVDETLLDAGHVATHGRFVHLYLNGQYWGQYHLRERFNDDFLVSYEGGEEEDFEAINGNANQGSNFGPGIVQSGSGVAWNNVNSIVDANNLSPSQRYEALRGAVNLEQYVDWLLIFMAGQSENEFRAVGSSDGSVPFIFHFNDADGWLRDPVDGSGGQGGDKTDEEGPGDILEVLLDDGDPEFLSFYADRIQRMFLNDGPLSVGQSTARLQELIDQVELSVILEEARWGTTSATTSPTGGSLSVAEFNARSQDAIDRVLPNIVERSNNIIVRLQNRGVFPDLNAPEILVDGTPQYRGEISVGAALTFSANSTTYYTLDGSDPRLPGGGLNPNAIPFNPGGSSIILNSSTEINSRTLVNGEFSPLSMATLLIPATQSELRITEINFNPAEPSAAEIAAGFDDSDDFEFIEIFNSSTNGSINLNGVQLSDGVTFDFGDFNLQAGERAVVVEDIDAFMARYGNSATILGEWSGGLSNSGEEVTLLDSSMNEIQSVNYRDSGPWYFAADGLGFSLVLEDPLNTPVDELGKYYSWRASTEIGGTPGTAPAAPIGVVINEVLANSDGNQTDAIELFNTANTAIHVGGWFLSDEGDDLLKFEIPIGTVIAAGGHLVFDETDFNASATTGFALSSAGDQVFLSQAVGGVFSGLEDSVEFGATFDGDSLGRLPNGSGALTRLATSSFGSANGDAEVGPLVISEVNYHPGDPSAAALSIDSTITDSDLEYIEIANPTSAAIDLTDWRIRGESDFDFAPGTTLGASQAIVVVSFDPVLEPNKLAAFEAHYNTSSSVTIVGGLSESLSNSSGRVSLQQPDLPDALGEIPHVVIDEVIYDDLAPFPDADGNGQSLERADFDASGNLATSWIAAAPTPGVFDSPFLLGDVTQNGVVDFLDISPFIDLLVTGAFQLEADINQDGNVDFLDISPFITLLSSGN